MPRLVIYIFLFLSAPSLFAQDGLKNVLRGFDQYQDNALQEKVFVHTDRSVYLTGDYLWLKVNVVDGTWLRPVDLSKVVYVELLDRDNKPVLQAKVSAENGKGNTSLFLPASLNSGIYQLRAYTRWMRNFSPEFYFHRVVEIINPFKPLPASGTASTATYDVQFFPEGGNLIAGIETKVAFRVVDQHGIGIPFRGAILNQNGETVVTFTPLKFGLGHFTLNPVEGDTYHAVIRNVLDQVIAEKELPQPTSEGYSMNLSDEGERLSVQVSYHSTSNATPVMVYLLAHTRGKLDATAFKVLQQNRATFTLDKKDLSEGVTHITIFDENAVPVCERLFFIKPQAANILTIAAHAGKEKYSARQPVDVTLTTTAATGPHKANLSMSVFRIDSIQPEDPASITNYFFLTSELRGTIESPEYYLSSDQDVAEATDNLMLTHGWRRFTWKQIVSAEPPAYKYIPEHRSHIITASLEPKEPNGAIAGIPVYLSVPGKHFILRGAKSSRRGNLLFELKDFYGPHKLIVQTNTQTDSMYAIHVDNPFSTEFGESSLPPFSLSKELKDQLITRSVDMQVENAYFDQVRAVIKMPHVDSTLFYGKPDERYYLDDYTRFPTMEDVMREYVPGIFVRKRKNDFYFMALNRGNNSVFHEDPLVLLDGVPVFNTNKIMEYDPLKVQRLDVITRKYLFGPLSFSGIASYLTYSGDLPDFTVDKHAVVLDYEGLQWERQFFSPVYETERQRNSRLPDMRNLLYWSPDINTDAKGHGAIRFYTSDQPGRYWVNIQGLTDDGLPGNTSFYLEVAGREND